MLSSLTNDQTKPLPPPGALTAMQDLQSLDTLAQAARSVLSRAHVPYSGQVQAVAVMDESGRWVPGVRVENASFSLTIPALRNALTTAVALELGPIVAVAAAHPLSEADRVELHDATGGTLHERAPGLWSADGSLPTPTAAPASPFLPDAIASHEDGLQLAGKIAERALVPQSNFPVGCVAVLADGRAVPGVNVERSAWPDILCAERNVLGTLVSYGLGNAVSLYVVCLRGACSPCGACRQVLAELAPEGDIWMLRDTLPLVSTTAALLPDAFLGSSLGR